VVLDATGKVVPGGCHPTKAKAQAHLAALNANVKEASMGTELEELIRALDQSAWDANRAMGQCSSAADYRSICAGERTVGEPDQRQHWALPHHYLRPIPTGQSVRACCSPSR